MQKTAIASRILGLLILSSILSPRAQAADWPKIPDEEWKLTEVGDAPAVILLRSGSLRLDDKAVSSYLEIYQRLKILNEEGRRFATVSLPSADFLRMRDLEGRTHLPADRSVVPLDKDAKFEKRISAYYKWSEHSFALPAVEVGSIIEYRYRLYFDSIIYTDPWYFQAELPVLRSEISCEYPGNFTFAPVKFSPIGLEIKEELKRTPNSQRLTYWMENLPAIADEPSRFPFQDLATWALFIPQELSFGGSRFELLKDWQSAIDILQGRNDPGYKAARRGGGSAKAKAKELAAAHKQSQAKAEALYRFVRDDIRTEPWTSIQAYDRTIDKTLKEAAGNSIDKALLLQVMLDEAGIESSIGLVRPRDRGKAFATIQTPFQFEHAIVVSEIGKQRIFLDPSEEALPFGLLPPNLEGVTCFLTDGKKEEFIDTPRQPPEAHQRLVRLQLRVTEEGVLEGSGTLWLQGHYAVWGKQVSDGTDEPLEFWRKWLEARTPGFKVDAVELEKAAEDGKVRVAWKLSQSAAEALGDEVSLNPSLVLGLTANPFSLPPARRRLPVLLPLADVDGVEVDLGWPEGWKVDALPKVAEFTTEAGSLKTSYEVDQGARTLHASRSFKIAKTEFLGSQAYLSLHLIYSKAAANDAEQIVLVRQ